MTRSPRPFGLCASVPARKANLALARLGDEELRDRRYRVRQETERDRVLIPIGDGDRAASLLERVEILKAPLEPNPKRAPIARIRDRLTDELERNELDALPTGWSRLGDVLVLRLPDELGSKAQGIAQVYADVLDVDSVLHLEGSRGPLREPETELLYGNPDTATEHNEHGITYRLDPSEVMFSPGNQAERHRLTDRVEQEHIVDLFAGIGYFTLPLAQAGAEVTACELNPTAVAYLRENVEANGLLDRVDIREDDCRKVAPQSVADRVLMGYLPQTHRFLRTALEALSPQGGVIHYHDTGPQPHPVEAVRRRLEAQKALREAKVEVADARTVKTLDPETAHVVLDLVVQP